MWMQQHFKGIDEPSELGCECMWIDRFLFCLLSENVTVFYLLSFCSVGVQPVGRMLAALGAVTRRTQRKGQSERMHHSCKYIYFGCLGLCCSIGYVVHWALSVPWLASIGHFLGWPTERQKGEGLNRRITRHRVAVESILFLQMSTLILAWAFQPSSGEKCRHSLCLWLE